MARRCGGWSVAPVDECDTSGKVVISHGNRWPHAAAGHREGLTPRAVGRWVRSRKRVGKTSTSFRLLGCVASLNTMRDQC